MHNRYNTDQRYRELIDRASAIYDDLLIKDMLASGNSLETVKPTPLSVNPAFTDKSRVKFEVEYIDGWGNSSNEFFLTYEEAYSRYISNQGAYLYMIRRECLHES